MFFKTVLIKIGLKFLYFKLRNTAYYSLKGFKNRFFTPIPWTNNLVYNNTIFSDYKCLRNPCGLIQFRCYTRRVKECRKCESILPHKWFYSLFAIFINTDCQHYKISVLKFLIKFFHRRHLIFTWFTPCSPYIQEYNLSFII